MKMIRTANQTLLIGIMALSLILLSISALGEIPRIITFQGKLTDADGKLVDEPRTLTFRLYHSLSGGTALWEEIHTDTPVTKGIFAVPLGVTTPLPSDFNTNYWVSIQVQGETAEMAPRQQLTASPYAFQAEAAKQAEKAQEAQASQVAGDATRFDGQLPAFYLARENHTGTIGVGQLDADFIDLLNRGSACYTGIGINRSDTDWHEVGSHALRLIAGKSVNARFQEDLRETRGQPGQGSLRIIINGTVVSTQTVPVSTGGVGLVSLGGGQICPAGDVTVSLQFRDDYGRDTRLERGILAVQW